jgi:hypothetical protein
MEAPGKLRPVWEVSLKAHSTPDRGKIFKDDHIYWHDVGLRLHSRSSLTLSSGASALVCPCTR